MSNYIHGTEKTEQQRLAMLNRLTNPSFIDFLEIEDYQKILEVGSGLGILVEEIATQFPTCHITGLEYSKAQLAAANDDLSNVHFRQGDAHQMPFEDNSFDVVYCRYVLEHVQNPDQVLSEMRRVLKPNGKIFVQENNIEILFFNPDCLKFDDIWRRFIRLQAQLGGDGAIGKRLYQLLRKAGFENVVLSIEPQVHGFEDKNFKDWVDNIIGNIQSGYRQLIAEKLAKAAEIDEAIEELNQLKLNPYASALFYWNRAKGKK